MDSRIRIGSAVVLENGEGEILLTKRKYSPEKGKWVLPGGGINFGETFKETAERELKEETGLRISIGDRIGVYELIKPKTGLHRVIAYHRATLVDGTLKVADDADDGMWIKPEKISSVENLGDLVTKVLKNGDYI
ncbi:MAG: NUDIX domain-containing protein [Candidatus Aenigmarchaeota archaeon]|nr:NUDIX domain-containing protein [Candidatus Aenigmarchaeota archaeon]